ncbi:MAG: ferredoxin [bacterium]|nr:ferredoxin [bacterium]
MSNFKEYLRDKPDSKISKIIVNRDICIGVASCVAVADSTFKLDEEAKAIVIDPLAADDQTLLMAAQSCPVQAILLIDKAGKQVFP